MTGGSLIVLTQTVQFLLAFLLAPRHGVLRRQSNLST